MIEHYMEYQYWTHCMLFPHLMEIYGKDIEEVHSSLTFATISMLIITSKLKNCVYAELDLNLGFIPGGEMTMDYTPNEIETILCLVESENFKGQS